MRKCAQCGKDIPMGNSSCNYCGYNPGEMNKKSGYSFGKASNTPVGNVNANGSKVGKIILIIFLVTFFGPFILGIILMIIMGILFANGVFEEEGTSACNTYCEGEYQYVGDHCYCSNGEIYDEYGDALYDFQYGDVNFGALPQNIHLFETDTLDLERYINNNEDVVVVVCSDFDPTCSEYSVRMMDIARDKGFNLFIYKYELLNEENKNKLLYYYLGVYDEFYPLTFIMSNGKMKNAHEKNMIRSEILEYLENNGII